MARSTEDGKKFGTFGGVFTPCTLTILGVIMFLRFGFVVGQSGIWQALLIVLCAKLITTLTSLSLSAIASNTRVRGGGAYYLISRSLGVEFGGAIGILFYLAQAISVSMYVIGFTEALTATVPALESHFVFLASVVNVGVFICVWVGANWAIKIQYVILAALGLALASFFCGAFQSFDLGLLSSNLGPHYSGGQTALGMFALFFPAVTGIMAGANMSGDLKNPSRSIPRGTLLSVLVTGLIYLALAVLLGGVAPREKLVGDAMVLREVSALPVLITLGVFAATLSSALGSMMGAPRILQAFARDDVFPTLRYFSIGSGKSAEPRRATALTFVIAQFCVFVGDLDLVAPIITMFFMITYGLLNLATFYEAVTRNPSYRPTFRYCPWPVAFLGTVSCAAVMFLIDWRWAFFSMFFIAALHWFIRWREIESRWGNLQSGLSFERVRQSLLQLEDKGIHPKNWRPVIMALSGSGWTRPHIPIYGHWLASGHGVLTLAQVVARESENHAKRRASYELVLRKFIKEQEISAFPAIAVYSEIAEGLEALIQCQGVGGLRPNTVLLGWPRDAARAAQFGTIIRLANRLQKSVLAARFLSHREPMGEGDEGNTASHQDYWRVPSGAIDVWWRGQQNGALMLLLAHLLRKNQAWRGKPIRLLRVIDKHEAVPEVERRLLELATNARIPVRPCAVVSNRPTAQTLQEESADAALVILGFQTPEEGDEERLFERMEQLAGSLPRVLFVDSAGDMILESESETRWQRAGAPLPAPTLS